MQMENGVCLPTRHEHHLQRENYITLTERAAVEIPCLACLKRVVCKHIPRQYSKEMAEKSEMVLHSTIYWKWLTALLLNRKNKFKSIKVTKSKNSQKKERWEKWFSFPCFEVLLFSCSSNSKVWSLKICSSEILYNLPPPPPPTSFVCPQLFPVTTKNHLTHWENNQDYVFSLCSLFLECCITTKMTQMVFSKYW